MSERYEAFKASALALCISEGATENVANALLDAYHAHNESNEGPWQLGPDKYYDILESHHIGHRQLRPWIYLKQAGESVTATRRGKSLFDAIEGLEK